MSKSRDLILQESLYILDLEVDNEVIFVKYAIDTYNKAIVVFDKIFPLLSELDAHIFHGFNGGIDLLWESIDNNTKYLFRLNSNVDTVTFYWKTPTLENEGVLPLDEFFFKL